ncbi:ATP phosphoribosyltransferase [Asticcacaulis sp. DW145]|uniref:ATP phosphoribosyltransferase n=1 Tax=Asticcacaulis currens TaxID=2984210 RepID=A0ABT5ICL8_9CAUL|nr:ATP phosphoribosyltransferase [Asticcacaulis currens]MDC7693933.1 ATP phosphoribosyltransferase [Asticcacaulis currens]BEV10121.1 ATP phosphoribosyltransferase [Asticcacaulis sp. DW145]
MPSETLRLRIAVQKSGRLADRSLELISGAGLRVMKGANELLYRIENQPIDLLRVRDDDIPTFVADGVAELGIVGYNVLAEHFPEDDLEERIVMRLGFGKCTLKIAVPDSVTYEGPQSLEGKRIATSYPNILGKWLKDRGVSATIVEMRGAVEVAPRMKIAHAICDLVSTGATLEANGMKAVDLVLASEAVLIKAPHAPPVDLAHVYDMLLRRFDGVTASNGAKYVMLNAPREHLNEIIELIPGADAPTIMPLAGREDTVAVHAVCQENVFWDTLDKLKAAGASAILVLPIEKMMK